MWWCLDDFIPRAVPSATLLVLMARRRAPQRSFKESPAPPPAQVPAGAQPESFASKDGWSTGIYRFSTSWASDRSSVAHTVDDLGEALLKPGYGDDSYAYEDQQLPLASEDEERARAFTT